MLKLSLMMVLTTFPLASATTIAADTETGTVVDDPTAAIVDVASNRLLATREYITLANDPRARKVLNTEAGATFETGLDAGHASAAIDVGLTTLVGLWCRFRPTSENVVFPTATSAITDNSFFDSWKCVTHFSVSFGVFSRSIPSRNLPLLAILSSLAWCTSRQSTFR